MSKKDEELDSRTQYEMGRAVRVDALAELGFGPPRLCGELFNSQEFVSCNICGAAVMVMTDGSLGEGEYQPAVRHSLWHRKHGDERSG